MNLRSVNRLFKAGGVSFTSLSPWDNYSILRFMKKSTFFLRRFTSKPIFGKVWGLTPHVFPHFLVLPHALGKDFLLDENILEAGMVFDEVSVESDIAVKDFRRGSHAPAHHVVVSLTEADIGLLLADGVLCHLEGIPNGDAVGEEVAALGLGDIAQGVVGGAVVEAGVVGDDGLHVVLLAQVGHVLLGSIDGDDLAQACRNLGLIDGALFGIVGRIEQLAVSAENVIDNEAEGLIDPALLVMDTAAQVVHHRVVQAVGGLGVDGQIVVAALVDSHR